MNPEHGPSAMQVCQNKDLTLGIPSEATGAKFSLFLFEQFLLFVRLIFYDLFFLSGLLRNEKIYLFGHSSKFSLTSSQIPTTVSWSIYYTCLTSQNGSTKRCGSGRPF